MDAILDKVETKNMHVMISGRVQGVGYRAWTRSRARRLELSGWVRNRTDGRVEALFCGAAKVVDQMIEACYDGPLPSRVLDIEAADSKESIDAGFTMRETV